jgi:single-strand DNA-binding protein
MADNQVTLVGNITQDPELRFTPSGSAVANFTVAVNRRFKQGDQWEDRLDGFFNCSCWRDMAENVAESLRKGTRVVVVGRLQQRSWDDRETGNKRTAIEVQVDEVAPSLRWATATIQKSQRSGGSSAPQGGGGGGGADDWSSPAPASTGGGAPEGAV